MKLIKLENEIINLEHVKRIILFKDNFTVMMDGHHYNLTKAEFAYLEEKLFELSQW